MRQIMFGGDYNPEQWPAEVWAEDIKLMTQARVSLVSAGIFSWSMVEPAPGEYTFGWFDDVMDRLGEGGIGVSLATMTASPPPWLSRLHPEILPQRADGATLWPGSRQHYCPSSPVYRDYAGRLVHEVARRYGQHPALRLWHIGNEYGCHQSRYCYCDVSTVDFRRWLRDRYGDLDGLNEAWSTTFWSQRYSHWDEIFPPRIAPTFLNPAQQLDFARFSDDAIMQCYLTERDIIRGYTPDVAVTTNFIGLVHKPINSYRWAAEQDVVSLDSYPDPCDPAAHVEAAFGYDLIRSARQGQPWLLMEQAPGAVNWRPRNVAKPPGLMRLWSWQAIAQGADAVMFFQWRQARGGAEKFHSAMVPHGGQQSRAFNDIQALGQEIAECAEIAGSRVSADVALLHDWENWWAVEGDAHPGPVNLLETQLAHYKPLFDAHITCDVVAPTADLSRYKLVVIPNLYLMTLETGRALTDYVRNGGHLMVSFFSGIVDECERIHLGGYPAPLREILGLHIDEFWPLADDTSLDLAGKSCRATAWAEWLELEGAEAVARFESGDLAGRPAITRHEFGAGVTWYLGTRPDPQAMRALMDLALADAGVSPVLPGLPQGLQAIVRHSSTNEYLFLLNHGSAPATVRLPAPAADLLVSREHLIESATVAPRGVAVLRRDVP